MPEPDVTSSPVAGTATVVWAPLAESDLADIRELAAACLEVDGGLQVAADPGFLRSRWTGPDVVGVTVRDAAGRLIAAGAARPPGVFTGMVRSNARGLGLGARLLDWGLDRPGTGTVETEGLTATAEELFASRGLRQTFAEHVMRIGLAEPPPLPVWPDGTTVATWNDGTLPRFYAAYQESFRERPGFPGWSAEKWAQFMADDDEFRPEWSLLATVPGSGDAGFVTAGIGWIAQVGVVPGARGRGIGAALMVESLRRMRAGGMTEAWLDVNVDNPARGLYQRLGFADRGIRAHYQR